MPLPPHIAIPFVTALGYAIAALLLKRAMREEVGPWRVTFVCNLAMALLFAPLWLAGGAAFSPSGFAQACLAGTTFFAGQVFTFLALGRGDVSVATPVLGTKVIFVALLTVVMLGETVPLLWWIAAFVAVIATALLQGGGAGRSGHHGMTVLCSFASAASFALTDVLVQKSAPAWGFQRFIPIMFGAVGVWSFGLVPLFKSPLCSVPRRTWLWLAPGAVLLAVQALGMAFAITRYGHATVINIVYSSRGVWTVLLVWLVGDWFGNMERERGHAVMGGRLAGAGLIIVAIWLVMR